MYRKKSEVQNDIAGTNLPVLTKGTKTQRVKANEEEKVYTTERAVELHEDEGHVNKNEETRKSSRRRVAGADNGKKDARGEATAAAAPSRRGSPASHRLRSASSPLNEEGEHD